MLDRIGGEIARATTIVRFAKGSSFSAHTHGGGEEFIVLEGVFQDESGDFPAGSYVRNPPTSHHTPASEPGCTIFVKLWQMDTDDRRQMSVDINSIDLQPARGRSGVTSAILYRGANEVVRVEHWAPGTMITLPLPGGAEILTLEGGFSEHGETFTRQSWLRLPTCDTLSAEAGPDGAKIWIKEGHLARTPKPPA